jgi:hypothetical protein
MFILNTFRHHNHVKLDQLKLVIKVVIKIFVRFKFLPQVHVVGLQSRGGDIKELCHDFALSI